MLPPSSPAQLHGIQREQLIHYYFLEGYTYRLILCFLLLVHGIPLSLRQLKRVLCKLGLKRRVPRYSVRHLQQVEELIRNELHGSGVLLGCRAMCHRLKQKYGISVGRETVRVVLSCVDPDDVDTRKKRKLKRRMYHVKGPNEVWHCDGYDKLKPYGFAIHGCVDGYSRRIIWLEVGISNNDPRVVASYYLKAVKHLKGAPKLLRCDLGTENSRLAYLQPFLRRSGSLSDQSFRYGKSVSNQRIEAWWSQFRRWNTDWWLNLFEGLKYEGLFDKTNPVHMDCLRFTFMHIIQEELMNVAREWNTHRIRPNQCSASVPGIPDELFFLPELGGAVDHICPVDPGDIMYIEQFTSPPGSPVPFEFLELVELIMEERGLHIPHTVREAVIFYVELLDALENV